ncbi:MAG TPA: DivIVA domain-containing protein [Candidatus Polarisedimenticolia bacterium]|jgi:cell division initiation protein|nr:DivIVA domain-containing protein [Candidatus Polarisedimenticolia bacterium]
MRITPLDVRGHRFAVKLRGYDREEVQSFLNFVSEEFEKVVNEVSRLREETAQLKSSLGDLTERERILKETLFTAQKLSEDMKEEAKKEGRLVIREAELRGQKVMEHAQKKVSQLEDSIRGLKMERDAFERKLRVLLDQHLKLLDMHREEEVLSDKLTFIKQKPPEQAPGS